MGMGSLPTLRGTARGRQGLLRLVSVPGLHWMFPKNSGAPAVDPNNGIPHTRNQKVETLQLLETPVGEAHWEHCSVAVTVPRTSQQ